MAQTKHMETRMWFGRPGSNVIFTAAYGCYAKGKFVHFNFFRLVSTQLVIASSDAIITSYAT